MLNLLKHAHRKCQVTTNLRTQKFSLQKSNFLANETTSLTKFSQYGIYMKGTDLNRKTYNAKEAEDELLLKYYQNYIDKEAMAEDELKEYQIKVEKIEKEIQERKKREAEKLIAEQN